MSYASAAEIRKATAELLRPPRRVSVSEAAAKYLRVATPGGFVGHWDPEKFPYMVEPMDMTSSRHVTGVVFVGPAQSGKTFSLIGGRIAYGMVCDPADQLIIQMSQDTARDFSRKELDRWIRNSPEIAARLSTRARDDNTYDKFWRNGAILKIGWPAISQVSSKSLRDAMATDYDRMPADIDGEGALFGLLDQRIKTWGSRGIAIVESSPGYDIAPEHSKWKRAAGSHEAPPVGGILGLFNNGDRGLWFWPCPHCGEYFEAEPGIELFGVPGLEQLRDLFKSYSVGQLVARWSRPAHRSRDCGALIEPEHKRAMNSRGIWLAEGERITRDGEVTGAPRKSQIASYWLGGVAAAFQVWDKMVLKHLQAAEQWARSGELTLLRQTTNTDQGAPFLIPVSGKSGNAHELAQRCESWVQMTVPHGVRFLTAQVDVQAGSRRGFVVKVIGWGVDREKWIVDRYALMSSTRPDPDRPGEFLPIDPAAYVEDWGRLIEKCIERRYLLADGSGRSMPVRLTVCDSGGEEGVTSRAYDFHRVLVRKRLDYKFRLVKGGSSSNAPRVEEKFPDTRGRADRNSGSAGDVPVLLLNTDSLKDTVAADLARTSPGPGYYHFPDWLPTSAYEELTAEVRTAKGWVNASGRKNESVDLCAYGEAAYIRLKAEAIDWTAPPAWAAPWDQNPDVRLADVPPPPRPTRQRVVVRSKHMGRR